MTALALGAYIAVILHTLDIMECILERYDTQSQFLLSRKEKKLPQATSRSHLHSINIASDERNALADRLRIP